MTQRDRCVRYGYAARLRPPRCSRANSRSHSPSARAESRRGARDRWARHAAFSLMCSTAALRGIYGLESRSLCVPRVACCCRCGSRLDPCRRVCLRGLSGSPLLSRCPSLSPLSLSLARESPSRRPSWYCDDRLQEGGAPAPGGGNGLAACRRAAREAVASRCAACISHRWVPPQGSTYGRVRQPAATANAATA